LQKQDRQNQRQAERIQAQAAKNQRLPKEVAQLQAMVEQAPVSQREGHNLAAAINR